MCCVFDGVCELFGETIHNMFVGVFAILLLKVMELLCVVGGALLDRPCMVFHRMCVCCACGHSERLDAHSICFLCVFVCRK